MATWTVRKSNPVNTANINQMPPLFWQGRHFIFRASPHNSRLTAQAPLRRLRHGICVAKMLDKTSSIICAFGLAAAAPRSPYRHLELCGIALGFLLWVSLRFPRWLNPVRSGVPRRCRRRARCSRRFPPRAAKRQARQRRHHRPPGPPPHAGWRHRHRSCLPFRLHPAGPAGLRSGQSGPGSACPGASTRA